MSSEERGQPLTIASRRTVKPGCEAEFEDLMRGFIAESLQFPGSTDFHVLRPSHAGSREYTVVHRFADEAARRAFVDAPMYREWMARLREVSEADPQIQELGGLAGWFTLPDRPAGRPPPKYKMAAVTFLGVYPLSTVLPPILGKLFPESPPAAVNVITSAIIVSLLTWVVMPGLTRCFSSWLFHTPELTS